MDAVHSKLGQFYYSYALFSEYTTEYIAILTLIIIFLFSILD